MESIKIVCQVIALSLLPVAPADAESTATHDSLLDSALPIVLTPSRLPQRLDEAPNSVTVIDRALIESSGARRLVDVLRLVPGFLVGTKNSHLPTATYHGLSDEFARRTLLLVDGKRIFQYARGVIEWNNLPLQLEDIERIEVVRGPNAATYGSNALQAVINIQTRKPAENRGVYGRFAAGTDGVADGFLRGAGQVGPLDYSLSLAQKKDRGYEEVPDDRRNRSITLTGEIPVNETGELRLNAGYARGQYEVDNPDSDYQKEPRSFPVTDNFQNVQWWQPLGQDAELTVTLSHNGWHYDDQGFTSSAIIPGILLAVDYEIEEDRYEAELAYSRYLLDQWRIVAGLGYYHESTRSSRYFDDADALTNNVSRLFSHGEYRPWDNLVINVGGLLEYSDIADDWLILPRLSLNYHLTDRHTVRVIYSTGSRQPTLHENQSRAVIRAVNVPLRIYGAYSTGHLDPEINRSLELGFLWHAGKSLLDVRLYREEIHDYIGTFFREAPDLNTVLPGHQVMDFGNDNTITIHGVEAQLDWRRPSGTRIFTSYAFTDIDAQGTDFDAGYEQTAPRHAFGLLLSQDLGNGWQGSLNYDYQSSMTWYRDEPIDAYHKLDARLAKDFKIGDTHTTVELIGTHLLGPISDYLPNRAWDQGVFLRFSMEY